MNSLNKTLDNVSDYLLESLCEDAPCTALSRVTQRSMPAYLL